MRSVYGVCCVLLATSKRSVAGIPGVYQSMGTFQSRSTTTASSQAPDDSEWHKNPVPKSASGMAMRATLGAGCYWGTEKFVKKDWGKATGAVARTSVGFMGPQNAPKNPTYRQVCSGRTGHVEVLNVEFTETDRSAEELYEDLIRFFFQFHDPTTENRQGNDTGTQYASVIYFYDDKQREIAIKVKTELQDLVSAGKIKRYSTPTVHTAILPATEYYPAHAEHQDYLANNPNGYCNHFIRFKNWPQA